MKDSKKLFNRLGLISICLCALCCLLPIAGVLFGIGVLTFVSSFLETAGIIVMAIAIVFVAIYFMERRKTTTCDVDCACKNESDVSRANVKTES